MLGYMERAMVYAMSAMYAALLANEAYPVHRLESKIRLPHPRLTQKWRPPMSDQEIERKWEERPAETEMAARILWDLWTTVKRLDSIAYDGDTRWVGKHSTGALSFYDAEDGAFYGNSGTMFGAHYDVLRPKTHLEEK